MEGGGRIFFKSARHFLYVLSLFWLKIGEWLGRRSQKMAKKQAFLWVFCPFSGNFRGIATASDSVIRWFESSYPSQFGIIRTSSLFVGCSDYFCIWTISADGKARRDAIAPWANDALFRRTLSSLRIILLRREISQCYLDIKEQNCYNLINK